MSNFRPFVFILLWRASFLHVTNELFAVNGKRHPIFLLSVQPFLYWRKFHTRYHRVFSQRGLQLQSAGWCSWFGNAYPLGSDLYWPVYRVTHSSKHWDQFFSFDCGKGGWGGYRPGDRTCKWEVYWRWEKKTRQKEVGFPREWTVGERGKILQQYPQKSTESR